MSGVCPGHPQGPPRLLVYCQHAVGIGHLMRLLRLIDALRDDFAITLLSGGHWPGGLALPDTVELVQLPALQMREYQLMADAGAQSLAHVQQMRRRLVLETLRRSAPDVLLIELYPFGRKKFAFELLPLIIAAGRLARRPRIVCSLRDILVDTRADQQRHDDRAARIINRYFDAVLVHADPAFATLFDSFRPALPLAVPVHHTGFIAPTRPPVAPRRRDELLVSVGGGRVGAQLLNLAVDAHALLPAGRRPALRLVVGPLGDTACGAALRARTAGQRDIEVVDAVDDLRGELAAARCSLSQGGYNTVMDLLTSGVKALIVPFSEGRENEQRKRAERLAALGLVRQIPTETLNASRLAAELVALDAFAPSPCRLNLDGAARSAELLRQLRAADVRVSSS
ncbi:MAG: glycosyltransferase family protein [Gammaproteobacteria bacterium]